MKDWQYTKHSLIVLTAILFFITFSIVYGYGSPPVNVTKTTKNAMERLMIQADKVLALASDATNVTELDPNPDLGTDYYSNPNPDLGTGYYPPPYTYDQCLGVFNKEACDFRFNR
jgi:hypothetical protein